ncbi:MAG: DHH family phosphoesterase, partial [Clostridia bacterium]
MLRFIPRDAHEMDERAAAALRPYAGVMARLLYARGVTDASQAERFLQPSLSQLHDPFLMSGMREAVGLLERACAEKLPTVVYGDYDVDGVCASALLTLALRRYGVNATTHVPLREEGYGLNAAAVRELAQSYKLLITVDLGITNHEEVRLAQQLGMTVIVTDHHALALENSPADAVINPLLGEYPFRKLCGTGVALKLAQALLGVAACEEYLDLAALATVADIVPLRGENRVLVALGLPKIAARSRAGMRALLEVSGGGDEVSAETLGFRLGPRLNAAGRLGDASKGV